MTYPCDIVMFIGWNNSSSLRYKKLIKERFVFYIKFNSDKKHGKATGFRNQGSINLAGAGMLSGVRDHFKAIHIRVIAFRHQGDTSLACVGMLSGVRDHFKAIHVRVIAFRHQGDTSLACVGML
jgi:hypothetical protein